MESCLNSNDFGRYSEYNNNNNKYQNSKKRKKKRFDMEKYLSSQVFNKK